ncbi:MAG: AAA family ATPase [Synechococcus sp.]
MQSSIQQRTDQPYKGFEPFAREDAQLFFGREKEIERIVNYLKSSRITVLSGTSGIGKSSLLQAGVYSSLHRESLNNIKRYGVPKFAVVVFDDWQGDTLKKLIDQIQNEIEELSKKKFSPWTSTRDLCEVSRQCIHSLGKDRKEGTLFIILDQFEEYFRYHPQPEEGKGSFEVQFPKVVNKLGLGVNFLISIREDMIAKLARFRGAIPKILQNWLRLEPLDKDSACDAILNPIYKVYNYQHQEARISVEPALVERILTEINSDTKFKNGYENGDSKTRDLFRSTTFQPSYLQVLMQVLWEEETTKNSRKLNLQTLQEMGGAKAVLASYFENKLEQLAQNSDLRFKEIVAMFIGFLVTPGGTKISYPLEDLATKADIEESQLRSVLTALSQQHLINLVCDRDKLCYEISYDILIPVILEWHDTYWKKRNEAKLIAEKELSLAGPQALQDFLNTSQLGALQSLVQAGEDCKQYIDRGLLSKKYSTVSMEIVLQQILDNIQETSQLESHKGAVCNVTFDPEGRFLVSSSEDGTACLWDLSDNSSMICEGHRNWIWGLTFSPDGMLFATASDDKTVRLWDLQGHEQFHFPDLPSAVKSVDFSRDGHFLAAGCIGGTVHLWNLEGDRLSEFTAHLAPVLCVRFSPDSNSLVTGSADGTICWWNLDGEKQKEWKGHRKAVWCVSFSPEGNYLASCSADKTIKLWDSTTGSELKTLSGHKSWVLSVCFSSDGQFLASGSEDCTARVWDVERGIEVTEFVHAGPVNRVSFSPNGDRLATASADRKVHLWAWPDNRKFFFKQQEEVCFGVSFNPDGQSLATGASDGTVCLWDCMGNLLQDFKAHKSWVKQVAFDLDGKRLATGSADGTIGLWDLKGNELARFGEHRAPFWSVSFSPNGQYLASGSGDGVIVLWNLQSDVAKSFLGRLGAIWSIGFSPDGQLLASGSEDGTVRLWDLQGKELVKFHRPHGPILSVSFHPDPGKQLLVSSSSEGTICLWDLQTGQLLAEFQAHQVPIWSVSFSPGGQYFASGSTDRTACLWDLEACLRDLKDKKVAVFRGHKGPVRSLSFSSDGQFLATASSDGTARLWRAQLEDFEHLLARGHKWLSAS